MSQVKEILENLCSVEGVRGAFLVNKEGTLSECIRSDEVDSEDVVRLITASTQSGTTIADSLNALPLKQCIVEYSDLNLTLDQLKNGATLAMLASSGANLGRIKLEIRKTKKEIEKILS